MQEGVDSITTTLGGHTVSQHSGHQVTFMDSRLGAAANKSELELLDGVGESQLKGHVTLLMITSVPIELLSQSGCFHYPR